MHRLLGSAQRRAKTSGAWLNELSLKTLMSPICPYCNLEARVVSEEHIFSEFLGGKRKIVACQSCNSRFGHDFEGRASKTLKELQVSIKSWGIPMATGPTVWKSAHKVDTPQKLSFDIHADGRDIQLSLSDPARTTEADGSYSILFRSTDEAQTAAKNAARKGKKVVLDAVRVEVPFGGVPFILQVDGDLKQLAVKMAAALAATMPDFSPNSLGIAQAMLMKNVRTEFCSADFGIYPTINSLRPSLAHVIYVERRQDELFAIVQFFGIVQLRILLGRNVDRAPNAAVFASLDPVSGDERFDVSVSPPRFRFEKPPKDPTVLERGLRRWAREFESAAIERGAPKRPTLNGTIKLKSSTR